MKNNSAFLQTAQHRNIRSKGRSRLRFYAAVVLSAFLLAQNTSVLTLHALAEEIPAAETLDPAIPGAEEAIYDQISDIAVSMKALDYLDMPEYLPVTHVVEMDGRERKLYEEMKKDLLVTVEGEEIDAANAAALSGKLLQMANGAIYGEDGNAVKIHDKKLLMLEDLIEQANGQNVLVAYWFRHDHERIIEHLEAKGYVPRDIKTEADIADWNDGKIQIGLISPASAGHGLNIQKGGHILIWFSLIWSLEMYQQTNARLWRQGQTEVVTAHHIVCKDTVDEDVIKALEHKDMTQQKLIAAVKAAVGR